MVYGAGGSPLYYDYAGSAHYCFTDALGSEGNVLDVNGATTGTTTYDIFGAVRTKTGESTSFTFTGEFGDGNGLVYLRARDAILTT